MVVGGIELLVGVKRDRRFGSAISLGLGGVRKRVKQLEKQMLEHARNLEFEQAARVRDQLALLREQAFGANVGDHIPPEPSGPG